MTGIIKVDDLKDAGGNSIISSNGSGTFTYTFNAGSIAQAALAADIIDGTKLADDAINSEHYTDGSIDNEHIADDAIDSEHYADGSIDLAHMSSQSVDEDNLYISNSGSNGQFLSKQSGNNGGLTWAAAGADFDTAITINESGADVNFRIEDNNNINAFFIEGGASAGIPRVGIGTASPEGEIHTTSTGIGKAYFDSFDGNTGEIALRTSRSATVGNHGVSQSGDGGRLKLYVSDGTNFEEAARIELAADATAANNDTPGRIKFYTTADGTNSVTERMLIDNTGLITIASGQINFPDSANVSTDANTLDDYQEGTFNLGSSQASNFLTGFYTKIGRMVWFTCAGVIPTSGNSATQTLTGLPFTVKDQTANLGGDAEGSDAQIGIVGHHSDSGAIAVKFVLSNNSTNANLFQSDNSVATHATFSGDTFNLAGFYTTDA